MMKTTAVIVIFLFLISCNASKQSDDKSKVVAIHFISTLDHPTEACLCRQAGPAYAGRLEAIDVPVD